MKVKDKTRRNLKIIGDNSASGGQYEDIRIIGDGDINGDIDCHNFKSVGDSTVGGNIKAEHLRTVGSIKVAGSAKSGSIKVTGNLDATGNVDAQELVIRGGINTKGSVKGGNVRLTGYVTISKSCEADTFRVDGQLKIDGLLNAEDVDIKSYGASKISEIGGDRIVVRKGSNPGLMIKHLFVPSNWGNAMVTVNTIEGDDIRLSSTRAKVVRGKTVIIENGCDIELVEYEDSLRVHHGSTVKQKRKV